MSGGGVTSKVEHTLWLGVLGVQLLRAGYAATMEPNCALAYGTNFKLHRPQFGLNRNLRGLVLVGTLSFLGKYRVSQRLRFNVIGGVDTLSEPCQGVFMSAYTAQVLKKLELGPGHAVFKHFWQRGAIFP